MPDRQAGMTSRTLGAVLLLSSVPAWVSASDLGTYRTFRFGAEIAAVAKQTGVDASRFTVLHTRPALIQQFEWRPGGLGSTAESDCVKDFAFTFYQGELYQIVVNYDTYGTEGTTASDFTEAISATYGPPVKPARTASPLADGYGGSQEVVAEWHDEFHRYVLIRSAYAPSFRLVGTQQKLQVLAETAILEAIRLDDREAPQREAARLAREDEAAASRLDESRRADKPKFRP